MISIEKPVIRTINEKYIVTNHQFELKLTQFGTKITKLSEEDNEKFPICRNIQLSCLHILRPRSFVGKFLRRAKSCRKFGTYSKCVLWESFKEPLTRRITADERVNNNNTLVRVLFESVYFCGQIGLTYSRGYEGSI